MNSVSESFEPEKVINSVRHWVKSVVVGLNLCPFAKGPLVTDRIRFHVSDAVTGEQLLSDLEAELNYLQSVSSVETTLLIHPKVLQDFYDYNQFLNSADSVLSLMELEGVYQIASFHPDYQFGGTEPDDVENYTNRSPYPILHLIREESLERAIANYPEPDRIPVRNISLLEKMGRDKMQTLLQACFDEVAK